MKPCCSKLGKYPEAENTITAEQLLLKYYECPDNAHRHLREEGATWAFQRSSSRAECEVHLPTTAKAQSSKAMKGAVDKPCGSPIRGTSFSSYALGSPPQLLSHPTKSSQILPSPRHSSAENLSPVPHSQEDKVQSNPPFQLHSTRIPQCPPSLPSSPLHFKPTSPPPPSGSPVHPQAVRHCHVKPCDAFQQIQFLPTPSFPPTTKPLVPCLILFPLRRGNDFSLQLTTFTGVQQFSYSLEDEKLYIFHAYGSYFTKWCQHWYSNLPFLLSGAPCNWWHLLGLIF